MPIPPAHSPATFRLPRRRNLHAPAGIVLAVLLAARPAPSGDILRGGAASTNANRPVGPSPAAAQAAAQARSNAKDALARTSRAVEAVQRAQLNAARASVHANNAGPDPTNPGFKLPEVPNGLVSGGLQVAPGVGTDLSLWTGAFLPTQTSGGGKTQVTVKQTSQQALLNWQTFNVGRDTNLHFDQSAGGESVGQWIAFNKVNDPTGRPSQILGSITAPGQVYVVNQNGIIFGGASQINVHTLVASSLPINDNLISRGLLNQSSTAQFLFSGLPQAGDVPFTPPVPPPGGRYGDVTVQPGAQLVSPTTDANVGGRIALVGANVRNQGTISTADGQAILAAGLQVGLAAHSASDPSLRGLDAFVGDVGTYAGTATNEGLIQAPRGSVAITGRSVNQLGAIDSSTSVSLNGRIDLRAEYGAIANPKFDPVFSDTSPPFLYGGLGAEKSTGQVTVGPGSVMRILPEWGSADKVIGTSLALRSQVNARGRIVHFGPGAMLQAPNGNVTVQTGVWDLDGPQNRTTFVRNSGQIYVDRDTLISVAGTTDAPSPLSNHILTVTLRSSELADAPLQRNSFFRGGDITVDLRKTGTYNGREWVGTPLADLRGYLNIIERTVDELTVAGGSVNLNSGGSIVVQPGAVIDTSAGWLNYGSGYVKTTRLLRQGRLVDIATATPDVVYDRIFTGLFEDLHPRWNITRTYRVPWMDGEHFEDGYLSGGNAGNLSFAAASMALDGFFRGAAVSGPRQTEIPAQGGTLDLSFEVQKLVAGGPLDPLISPTPPQVVFQEHNDQRPADPFATDAAGAPLALRADRLDRVVLTPGVFEAGGFSALRVRNPDGNITVPKGMVLTTAVKGSITLEGANVSIFGDVKAPGGNLSFLAYNISPGVAEALRLSAGAVLPAPNAGRGSFTLGAGSSLSAAGQIIDYRPGGNTPFNVPVVNDGGRVSIKSYSASLAAGSEIDVSGGVVAGVRGGYSYGRAGTIEILTGRDLSLPAVDRGSIHLGSTLKGFSGAAGGGGTLSIQAQLIQIGGSPLHPLALTLSPDFFSQGGFSTFNLTGIGIAGKETGEFLPAVNIAPGTRIEPQALGWLALPYTLPDGNLTLRPYLRPEGLRSPVNLAFNGLGAVDEFGNQILSRGDVVFGRGAVIRTDALGSVAFRGDTATILGSVYAPGGTITVAGANRFPSDNAAPPAALPTVYIGSNVTLSTAGKPLIQQGPRGWRQGRILPGGAINISGNIVAGQGALFDVSGSTGILDLPPVYLATGNYPDNGLLGVQYVPVRVDSNGGSIRLAGAEMLYTDATLAGRPGGPSATGGSLSISSGRFYLAGTPRTTADANLLVGQNGSTLPAGVPRGIGLPMVDAAGTALQGIGNVRVSSFAGGGFDALALGGNVQFEGPVDINLPGRLSVGSGGVIYANAAVSLTAPYVALGQAFRAPQLATQQEILFTRTDASGTTTPYFPAPTYGMGSITVRAGLIDVGNLTLQGIGKARLLASDGEIRGNGTLTMAGDLVLQAGQIYPTTLNKFNLFAYDYNSGNGTSPGSITVLGGAARQLPMSGGGTLSLYSSNIHQGGTLRAPIGVINLGWNGSGPAPFDPISGTTRPAPVTSQLTLAEGSVTSVSAVDPRTGQGMQIPFGISLDGITWIDPAGNDITVSGVPAKAVNLSAQSVTTAAGSVIDIAGGGDLFAYRWTQGTGGSQDILGSTTNFAIIPGYGSDFAPYAPFNPGAPNLGGATGYVNNNLRVGDQVTLGAGAGLRAGTYTLLPARYALVPGAYLVTPKSGIPVGSVALPDGSSLVSGFRANVLDRERAGVTLMERFEVAPASVFRERAKYEVYSANTFLRESAIARDFAVPRLPVDSGYLSFDATTSMVLQGRVNAVAPPGGRGSLVDISSPGNILINGTGVGGASGTLVLSAPQLNSFGAESLLIGGKRTFGSSGITVAAATRELTVDNAGIPLNGNDVILVSRERLTLADGATVLGTGSGPVDDLLLGDPAVAGSGDGALLRVSGSAGGSIARRGVSNSILPQMTVGAGATIGGGSMVLDSTYGTRLDPLAVLNAGEIALNSGQITIALQNAGVIAPTAGLVLAGPALDSIQASARVFSLLSYSSLDLYGTGSLGSLAAFDSLILSASSIRGYNTGGGAATLAARNILIDNATNRPALALPAGPLSGTLQFQADQITLGANPVLTGGYGTVGLTAADRVLASGTGSFGTAGDLRLETPLLTASQSAVHALTAGGTLALVRPAGPGAPVVGGLGARLNLQGLAVRLDSGIALPSGELSVRSTGGDVRIGTSGTASINLAGTTRNFLETARYTDGGIVTFTSDSGSVVLGSGGAVNVSAPAGGGHAGTLNVSAQAGSFEFQGSILGSAGAGRRTGSFTLDTAGVAGGALGVIDAALNAGSFTESRQYRLRSGNVIVDGAAVSHLYRVTADQGSLTVTGTIDASGTTGGTIELAANGSLILANGSLLDASGDDFSHAGKGGSISLTAGTQRNGLIDATALLDLRSGATLDLRVAANNADSPFLGQLTGTLHLRAPRNAAQTDLALAPLNGSILGSSSILAEGYRLYDLTGTNGTITSAVQTSIRTDGETFLGAAGSTTANYTSMSNRILGSDPQGLGPRFVLAPGAEIIHRTGDLTLGAANSTPTSDWNLQNFRFGPNRAPGVLTLRAAGNLTFFNALSDGFAAVTPAAANGNSALWLAPLMAQNPLLPLNTQSWSYRLAAGADLTSGEFRSVQPLTALTDSSGFIALGKNLTQAAATGGNNALTSSLISQGYQVIRTGSGSIDLAAGRSVRLLNPLASIYTTGTQVADPTGIYAANDFVTPILIRSPQPSQGASLGAVQQAYFAQYSLAGGNINITAGEDIERLTRTALGQLVPDSSRQVPANWLYRRGYVDPDSGKYGAIVVGSGFGSFTDPAASTTWWIDYSNFFQSVGALGGGNVTLTAGRNVSNMDAVAPTNARAPRGAPDGPQLVELGGGDIAVRAGNNIDAGIYYVERGQGQLEAGGSIITNSTRSPSRNYLTSTVNPEVFPEQTWLPTTLFLGKGSFDLNARGSVLLGPTTNPFLLPTGLGNKFWYKTYFSTYAPDSTVRVSALGGDVTLRNAIVFPDQSGTRSMLQAWLAQENLLPTGTTGAAFSQPWLRLGETSIAPFTSLLSLAPPRFEASALSGNINVVGAMTLSPAPYGTLNLLAGGAVNGLQPAGRSSVLLPGQIVNAWTSARLNVSDANPAAIPGAINPYAYFSVAGSTIAAANTTSPTFMAGLNNLFAETGSTGGVIQTKQALHTPGLLHLNDVDPVRVYALGGNLSGLTLFTPKPARIYASRDVTDISFYLQNLGLGDQSTVTAGRDVLPSNASSPLRNQAFSPGNAVAAGQSPLPGDIQVSGPGSLIVLAGRDLDLGTGPSLADGTGAGIISIGNARNPYLPFEGSNLVIGAGLGSPTSLTDSGLDFDAFIADQVEGGEGAKYLQELGVTDFASLAEGEQNRIALQVFYLILRDTGRNYATTQSYESGFAAIESLFGGVSGTGDILTQGRSVRTTAGGDISLFAPGGALKLANTTIGNPLVPPGIITESGGRVGIFTDGDVDIGIGRIFTLRGGDMVIWSSTGNIAAGSSSKTVASAPPTRVVIDPQSADVTTDLAGLATGGGIGVLATVEGVPPGSVDLLAPAGVIDAGDAGIRSAGNLTLAATQVLNASNIAVTGSAAGAPAVAPAAPAVSTPAPAPPPATKSPGETAAEQEREKAANEAPPAVAESVVTVEVIGYGGSQEEDEEEEKKRRTKAAEDAAVPSDGDAETTPSTPAATPSN